jgi:hypothetical protein
LCKIFHFSISFCMHLHAIFSFTMSTMFFARQSLMFSEFHGFSGQI